MNVCDRIKKRREELEMSQEELALKLGYKSRSSINKIEMGLSDIPFSKIEAFAKELKTTPAYLMGWEEKLKNKKVFEDVIKKISLKIKGSNLSKEELSEKSKVSIDIINMIETEKIDFSLLTISDVGKLMLNLNILPESTLNSMTIKDFSNITEGSLGRVFGTAALAVALTPAMPLLSALDEIFLKKSNKKISVEHKNYKECNPDKIFEKVLEKTPLKYILDRIETYFNNSNISLEEKEKVFNKMQECYFRAKFTQEKNKDK